MQVRRVSASSAASSAVGATTTEWLEKVLQPPKQTYSSPSADRIASHPERMEATEEDVNLEEIKFGEAIGQGCFGTVYRGTFRGQDVAIKQLELDEYTEEDDKASFLQEIRHLQTLRHHRLVSYTGCCHCTDRIVLLMECMPQGCLHDLLFGRKRQHPSFLDRARLGMQVAEGVAYLHNLSVVHRDLKSANIVLDDDLNAKICDFGLMVVLEKSHMTVATGEGSARYMAPEQFLQSAKITEKVDIWQTGCVLLELFCLLEPFHTAKSIAEISRHLLLKELPPPLPEDLDPCVRVLLESCFRIDLKLRPDAEHLQQALTGLCTTARAA